MANPIHLNITMYYAYNMEIITFKLQEEIVSKINQLLAPLHFNNRTEFIREAIREKINNIEKDLVLQELTKFKGAAKSRLTDEKLHKIREDAAKKYADKFGIKLN